MFGIELAIMAGMIALNSFFAAYEIALASITLGRLKALEREKRPGAAAAVQMKEGIEGSLAVVQLGITLVGAIAAATGGAGAEEQIAPTLEATFGVSERSSEILAILFVVVPLTAVTIVFGELIPKVFALRNQEFVCLRMSPIMRWFSIATWPIVWALESSVTGLIHLGERLLKKGGPSTAAPESMEFQELRASVALARASKLIGPQQERIMIGAAGLSQRKVSEVMLPAESIAMLDVNSSIADALVAAHLDMHTRFPVTERPGDPNGIVGYVNFKDIVAHMRFAPHEPSLRSITRALASFDDSIPAAKALEQLIRGHAHIALVRNPERGVVGMITLEDLIEELVGEIEDEFDRLQTHAVIAGRGWVVGGGITLGRLRDLTGVDLCGESPGSKTLSQFLSERYSGRIRGGEVIACGPARITIRKVRRQKVLEAYVEVQESPAPAAAPMT